MQYWLDARFFKGAVVESTPTVKLFVNDEVKLKTHKFGTSGALFGI